MRVSRVVLHAIGFILIAGRAATAADAKPQWRVVKAAGKPVLIEELNAAGEVVQSAKLLDSSDEVVAFALNDGQNKLAVSTTDRKIRVWDLVNQKPPSEPAELLSPTAPAVIIQVSGDGKWVASGDEHGRVTLWELREKSHPMHALRKPWLSHPVAHLKFSPDSRWLFSASNDTNKYRYFGALWKLDQPPFSADGFKLNANVTAFRSGTFDTGGRWFVTGHDNTSWIWDLEAADPSKKPVIVRRKPLQKVDEVELADGVWNVHRADGTVTISRKKDAQAAE